MYICGIVMIISSLYSDNIHVLNETAKISSNLSIIDSNSQYTQGIS